MLYKFDNYEIDADTFELRCDGVAQHVEPLVFDLLHFLIKNPDRIISRDEIIEHIWQGRIISDATISSCIKSARKALGDSGENQKYIKTFRGRGIQFLSPKDLLQKDIETDVKKRPISGISIANKGFKFKVAIIGALFVFVIILLFNQPSENNEDQPLPSAESEPYTIAVMPFMDMSANGDQEYFGDGISEEVLNVLTALDELDVTSRTTAFSLKGQNLSVPEISERLNVKYIVEGSVRSAGNRIRITAQLIEASSDTHLWSESYDRELTDIFAIQDDISQEIAKALKVELIGDLIGREAPTNNMNAYALYLQGHQLFLDRGTGEIRQNISNLENAITLLEQAVEEDPTFAEAWADLASSTIILPSYYANDYSFINTAPRATEAVNRAISLKPNLSQAWAVKGLIHLNQFQFQDAQTSLMRATELNPNNATSWLWLGLHFTAVGNPDEAFKAIENAIELAPNVAIYHSAAGMILHGKGDVDKAIPYMDKAIQEMGFDAGRPDRAIAAVWKNDLVRAKSEITAFFKSSDHSANIELDNNIDIYTNVYRDHSLRAEAAQIIEDDMAEGIDITFSLYMLQDGEKIVANLVKTASNNSLNLARIYYPISRPLFKQKALRDYIINIGLLAYWKNNQFPDFCRPIGEDDFECDVIE